MPSKRMRESVVAISIQLHSVMSIPGGHIGEDYLVADVQSLGHFHRAHRRPAEFDGHADGRSAALDDLEQADGAIGLALDGTSHVEDIRQPFELDGAVDAEI